MKRWYVTAVAVALVALLTGQTWGVDFPQKISYQGRLTDSLSYQVPDGRYLIKFTIYDAETGGTELWTSGFRGVDVWKGLFTYQLGDTIPLPPTVFSSAAQVWMGITVGPSPEIVPRTQFMSVPYGYYSLRSDTAMYAMVAERTMQGRDLYHQIIDVNPNSSTVVPFVLRTATAMVTLYLYGAEYQGTVAEHTHEGNNAHTHTFSGSVGTSSLAHTHSISLTSGSQSASHTHSGTTGAYNLAHTHSGSTSSISLLHSHTGTTAIDGNHKHDFLFQGALDGLYLVHNGSYTGLTAHGTWDRKALGSVDNGRSDHSHSLSINSALGSHSHTFTTASSGGNHTHSFSTGNQSASHSHSISGATGSHDIAHSHTLTGDISMAGAGLSYSGISSASLPGSVSVYVDGVQAAGPFVGAFTSGELDLSSYVSGPGDHTVEIVENGGSGGRITYNLFVE